MENENLKILQWEIEHPQFHPKNPNVLAHSLARFTLSMLRITRVFHLHSMSYDVTKENI